MRNPNEIKALVIQDFGIQNMDDENDIKEKLILAIAYLLDHDFSLLLSILYRADVDEEKLKILLAGDTEFSTAQIIAEAYLKRMEEKIITRKKYSK